MFDETPAFFETYLLNFPPDIREHLRGFGEFVARFDSEGATLRERMDAAHRDLERVAAIMWSIREEQQASKLSNQETKLADLAGELAEKLKAHVSFLENRLAE